MILSLAGAAQLWRGGVRDRLGLALAGWGGACLSFLVVGLLTPVDMRYYLAAIPAVALTAAIAAARAWRAGGFQRALAGVLLAWAVWVGVRQWIVWIG